MHKTMACNKKHVNIIEDYTNCNIQISLIEKVWNFVFNLQNMIMTSSSHLKS